MARLSHNILANFVGNGWTALMSLAFIPLYIRFMGIEAYGLVGLYATLQGVSSLLDMGVSGTLSRELARLSVHREKAREMRDLVRTLALFCWAVAAVLGVAVVLLASAIANHWVNSAQLPTDVVKRALMIMGAVLACQWPFGFYSGGLLGLQRQVLLNAVVVAMATLRGGGAVLVLWLVSPTIEAFFWWQMAVSLLQTLLTVRLLWRSLPAADGDPRFQGELLRGVWRFAAGISGITITAVILTQLDKILLSRLLSLEMFGYYCVGSTAAMSLYRLSAPVASAIFPRFTQLVSVGDREALRDLYHQGCQLLSVLILPAAMVAALFSREILFLWTRDPVLVEHAHTLLSILVIGTALSGLMNLPYVLQMAYGWTRLVFGVNAASLLVLVPALYLMTTLYGAVGAALVWLAINSVYVTVLIQLMHRRILPGEQWRWYWEDVGKPALAGLVVVAPARVLIDVSMPSLALLATLLAVFLGAAILTTLTAPRIRSAVLQSMRKISVASDL
jgi:O-antigen/teichoic acid export membrane protein